MNAHTKKKKKSKFVRGKEVYEHYIKKQVCIWK